MVNNTLQNLPNKYGMIGFASADGLTSNPDKIHFSAPALREFGLRYYEGYKALVGKIRTESGKETAIGGAASTKLELL